MYVRNGCSPKIASILTHLTTHNFELPQGTPTSTHIANLIFLPNDFLIISYCKNNNLTYSRFVDDLVFSSSFDFKMKCNDLIKIILNDNFRISYKKTIYKAGNMEICGIITKQNVLDLSDSFKKSLEDPTINKSKIDGRRRYYQRVRAK
jgi:RNA-directed DNA polymerase